MNLILSVYTAKAYKEYVLPNINNTNYSFVLPGKVYSTDSDVQLNFDVIENNWRLLPGADYSLLDSDDENENIEIKPGMRFEIMAAGSRYYLIVKLSKLNFLDTDKYLIQSSTITVGSQGNNDIVYKEEYVSRHHAEISIDDSWVIFDKSSNGVFVNGVRVKTSMPLSFGDVIDIIGLKIIFLEHILAVNVDSESDVIINTGNIVPVTPEVFTSEDDEEETEKKQKKYFNRAPRIMRKLLTETIEIEAPPNPKQEDDRSLISTVGPSVTMALPMLLGCALMIYSSRQNSGTLSPYMFTGLVTAISSATLGVFWGIINYRKNSKKSYEDEKHRFNAYSDYLMKMSLKAENGNKYNCDVLNELYPSAESCTMLTKDSSTLWNRNITHEDFLIHRIGIGDIPFQCNIAIPKERFTLIDDSLADKPALIRDTFGTLKGVPVCLDLAGNKLIGIVGGKNKLGAYEITRSLSIQIAASNCYTDVKLVYLFGKNSNDDALKYAKWFPHCWSEDKKTRYCAFNKAAVSDVCYELTKIFRQRDEMMGESGSKKIVAMPHYVIFVDDVSLLEGEPLAKYIFDRDVSYGLTTVLFAENYEKLPNLCECIVYNDGTYTGIYTPDTLSSLGEYVRFDRVTNENAEEFARKLSDIEVTEVATGGEVPATLSFLDMYGVDTLAQLNVLERWKKNRTYENMRALIGQKAGGADCYLDIHEKYHGPHGLVAGTTGSGKSETLQTYILSLAINYSPDDVGFLLVDFKGGGMANLFVDLPHTIGIISNLSGSQIRRAMVSIKSENHRRERIFSEHGVTNINAYTRLLKNEEAVIPLPHLFIIIDEFAEMKREEPEFMNEIISVAQVGRSLGVHLILATQKPGGVVDDNIRSNSKFKLCLRVQDRQDSNEMLGKPDAAYLTNAGRSYLQVGNDEIYELFQSGWSGATYDESGNSTRKNKVMMISDTGKATLSGNKSAQKHKDKLKSEWLKIIIAFVDTARSINKMKVYPQDFASVGIIVDTFFSIAEKKDIDYPHSDYNERAVRNLIKLIGENGTDVSAVIRAAAKQALILPEPREHSQLEAVISHLDEIFNINGYKKIDPLWLPVLPEALPLSSLDGYTEMAVNSHKWSESANWSLSAPVGLCDDPESQAQMPLFVNFATDGHLAVCGNVTSGKSTFLQTMIYSFSYAYSPKQLNFYILDYSNHMLKAFENYPHVGAVMYENNTEKTDKFFFMLGEMLNERKKIIGGGNYGHFVNTNGYELPAVVVAIDNYSGFREKTGDKYEKIIWEISRDGATFGIYLALSSGGFGSVEIPNRVAENIRKVFTLNLGDKIKYSEILRIMHLDIVPAGDTKGRGLAFYNEKVLEWQAALAFNCTDDYERANLIEKAGQNMLESAGGYKARQIPEIPDKPTWKDLSENVGFNAALNSRVMLPVAYVKETAALYSIDMRNMFCYLIQGKGRTGRTDFMKVLSASAKDSGADIVVFETGDPTMKHFYEKLGVSRYCSNSDEILDYCINSLTPVFKKRNKIKQEMIQNGAEDDEIFAKMAKEKPLFIFVPDFSDFIKVIYTIQPNGGSMSGFFENILEKGRLHNIYFVFDSNMDKASQLLSRKVYNMVTAYKCGIQLGGLSGQRVFDTSALPFAEQNKAYKQGVGFAFDADGVEKIVIPSSKGI